MEGVTFNITEALENALMQYTDITRQQANTLAKYLLDIIETSDE